MLSLVKRSRTAAVGGAAVLVTGVLLAAVPIVGLIAGNGREDNGFNAGSATTIEVDCSSAGTWQVYAALEVGANQRNAGVVVNINDATAVQITDAVVDNGYVDGTPPKISPGVADILFKDGGVATNDPILLEITAPRGHTSVSNFTTPIEISDTTLGLKAFRENPIRQKKNIAVTVVGTCQ